MEELGAEAVAEETACLMDYSSLIANLSEMTYPEVVESIIPDLEHRWYAEYLEMTPGEHCVDVVAWDTFSYMYDNPSTIRNHEFAWGQDIDDRTVVVYGTSSPVKEKRDWYRMRGPRGEVEWGETSDEYPYDRGHYIAHSIGGKEDVGLFPQRRDINRGVSRHGRVYRAMERYCFDNAGVFCFARPIYVDKSSHPFRLEFGVLRPDLAFWVELFENRYTDKPFIGPT